MTDSEALREALLSAALVLAVGVSTDEKIATDPTYAADRSPRAERQRVADRARDLAAFRAAQAAYK